MISAWNQMIQSSINLSHHTLSYDKLLKSACQTIESQRRQGRRQESVCLKIEGVGENFRR